MSRDSNHIIIVNIILHTIGQSLDKNTETDIVYLDFAKTFDSVDNNILLHKLKLCCLSGKLYAWFDMSGRYETMI
jgi:hypothetical protein